MWMKDVWDGPKEFVMSKALQQTKITPSEFYVHWKATLSSCATSERGKRELLGLLEKGGVRQSRDHYKRLYQQIWFVKQIVRRNTFREEATITPQVRMPACMYV